MSGAKSDYVPIYEKRQRNIRIIVKAFDILPKLSKGIVFFKRI